MSGAAPIDPATAGGPSSATAPLTISGELCDGCGACVTECPTGALSVVDGRAVLREESCVACARCIAVCTASAISTRDDLPKVRGLLESGRPVVALLASEFTAALFPIGADELRRALNALGFANVEYTTLGEELIADAYERQFSSHTYRPMLRSTCPVVVEWVRRYHPGLVAALAPLVPPYVAQARLIKEVYAPGAAVVYVSPCLARKTEAGAPDIADSVDAVIDFAEMRKLLAEVPDTAAEPPPSHPKPRRRLSINDGFPKSALEGYEPTSGDLHVAREIEAVDEVLRAIESGEVAPLVLDLLGCDSCLAGSAVGRERSLFAKRRIDSRAREAEQCGIDGERLLRHLPKVDLLRAFTVAWPTQPRPQAGRTPRPPVPEPRSRPVRAEGVARAERAAAEPEPVAPEPEPEPVAPEPEPEPVAPEREPVAAERRESGLPSEACAPSGGDGVDLSELLTIEAARSRRYGTPLSILVCSLAEEADHQGEGNTSCEERLASVCRVIASNVRATDSVRAAGPCEMALVLPGIGKTRAFLVAERLRDVLESRPDRVPLSIGVASLGGRLETGHDLRRAAAEAMRDAVRDGGDTTRIAGNRGE